LVFLFFLPPNLLRIRRIIKSAGVDLVHVDGVTNIVPALAAVLCRVPVVWHYNDHVPRPLRPLLLPLVAALSPRVIVLSERRLNCPAEVTAAIRKRATVVHLGIDTAMFDPMAFDTDARARQRARFGIDPDCPLVGAIGNINIAKGYEHFLAAAAQIKQRVPDARFIVVGPRLETDRCYRRLEQLTGTLGLEHDVVFAGFQEDIAAALAMLDVFVLSSVRETGPLVVLEAMAMKVPVVATDVGAVAEMMGDAPVGAVVAPRNARAIAEAACAILAAPAEQMQEGLSNLRSRVETSFGLDRVAEQQKQIYGDVLSQARLAQSKK
jgi:glycosyltransferase involved in cell wall biosynthesis